MAAYRPKGFWEKRLQENFSLKGVGNISYSSRYNKWIYRNKASFLTRALSEQNMDIAGASVCDLGCGTGFYIDYYHSRGAEKIVGVDIAETSVSNLAAKYPDYRFINEGIDTNQLVEKINEKFMIVNVFDVLYHIVDDSLFDKAIENISQLVANDGLVVLTDVFQNQSPVEYVVHRSLETYKKTLENYGLEIVILHPYSWIINRPFFSRALPAKYRRFATMLDELLVPVYYTINKLFVSEKRCNLSLLVARKKPGP